MHSISVMYSGFMKMLTLLVIRLPSTFGSRLYNDAYLYVFRSVLLHQHLRSDFDEFCISQLLAPFLLASESRSAPSRPHSVMGEHHQTPLQRQQQGAYRRQGTVTETWEQRQRKQHAHRWQQPARARLSVTRSGQKLILKFN